MMTHSKVYEIYERLLPFYAKKTKEYFQCGRNTIRVRMNDKEEFVFSYDNSRSWSFDTLDRYLIKMKGA